MNFSIVMYFHYYSHGDNYVHVNSAVNIFTTTAVETSAMKPANPKSPTTTDSDHESLNHYMKIYKPITIYELHFEEEYMKNNYKSSKTTK